MGLQTSELLNGIQLNPNWETSTTASRWNRGEGLEPEPPQGADPVAVAAGDHQVWHGKWWAAIQLQPMTGEGLYSDGQFMLLWDGISMTVWGYLFAKAVVVFVALLSS